MPNYTTNPNDIHLSERDETIYLLGNPPSWMTRYGIMVVAIFFSILLTLSYLIQYPDIVTCRAVLTTENPPIRVLAQSSNRISAFFIHENQSVREGQLLAILDNAADWQDVLKLETVLNAPNAQRGLLSLGTLRLGNLQSSYSTLIQNAKDYDYFVHKNGVATKIGYLQNQIAGLQAMNQNLLKQKDIQIKEFALTERDFTRQTQLHTEGVISDAEFEKFQTQRLQQSRQIEATEANFISNDMQIRQIESQINDLSQTKNDNDNSKQTTLS